MSRNEWYSDYTSSKKSVKFDVLVKNENNKAFQNLYIGIYGEYSSSKFDFKATPYSPY